MDADYRLSLLGPVRVERAGQPVHGFESRRALALLCYLAAQGQPQTRAHLADLFWPDKPAARGRGNLSRVLHNFGALLPGCVSADRETVTFNAAACWLDVNAFTALTRLPTDFPALTEAVALYRADFMAGLYLDDCPDFEMWLVIERERQQQRMTGTLHALIAHHIRRGEVEAGLRFVERLLALDPWREEAHRQKMLLLALAGQRSAALRQYEQCRQVLADELGVAPTPETDALYQRIAAASGDAPGFLPEAAVAPPLPLVGRADAHAWLLAQWEAVRRNADRRRAGGLTLIAGEAGIGKTRLIQETLRLLAGQGAQVLRGRCYEFNRALPYQALHEALRPALESAPPPPGNPLAQWLRPDAAAPADRAALFAAVAAWLRHIPRRIPRRVLFLDDLHWADADTLDLLHYLTRRLSDAPCWLVGAYRPGEALADHPLTRLKQTLNRDGLLHTQTLAPLSHADVRALTAHLLAAGEATALADYLFRESEGNPFYIVEALATLREQDVLRVGEAGWQLVGDLAAPLPLPARVQDVVLQRVARLDETGQYLLNLAAAHGQPFTADLLAAAGECPPEDVAAALTDWETRQLARPAAAGWDLAHDKIRAALYQAIPAPLRRLLHARLAAALEAHSPDAVALLAHHFDLARQAEPAARYLLRAGDQARQSYAQEQALRCYQRGLELTRAPDLRYALLGGLETVYDLAVRREEQRAALTELAELTAAAPPQQQSAVALRQAHYAEATSDYAGAATAAERAVALAQAAGDAALLAAGYRRWGYALRRQERLPEARALYEQARLAATRAADKGILSDALQGLANVAWQQGEFPAAQAYVEESLALCRELDDRRGEADAYNILGIVWQRQGESAQARDNYMRALELRRAIGDRRAQGLSHNNLGSVACELGDFTAAEAAFTTAVALCQEAHDRWGAGIAALGLAEVALERGDWEAAQAYAEQGRAELQQIGAWQRVRHAEAILERVARGGGT